MIILKDAVLILLTLERSKTNPDSKSRLWDIENLSATYAYTEYDHRDFITERALQKTYRAGLQYKLYRTTKKLLAIG